MMPVAAQVASNAKERLANNKANDELNIDERRHHSVGARVATKLDGNKLAVRIQ